MNKKLINSTLAAGLTVCFCSGTMASSLPKSLENQLIDVCKATMNNDVRKLKNSVDKVGIQSMARLHNGRKFKMLSHGLMCNGLDVMDFALKHDADKTYTTFRRFSSGKVSVTEIAKVNYPVFQVNFTE